MKNTQNIAKALEKYAQGHEKVLGIFYEKLQEKQVKICDIITETNICKKNALSKCYENVKSVLTPTFRFNIMQVLGKLRVLVTVQYFGKRRVPYAVDTGGFSEGGKPDEIVGKAWFRSNSYEYDCGSCTVITGFGIF